MLWFVILLCASLVKIAISNPTTNAISRLPVVDVTIDGSNVVGRGDSHYLSVSIDSAQLVGANFWGHTTPFNFSRPELVYLASKLGPAYLRVGGTTGDMVYYNMSSVKPDQGDSTPFPYKHTLYRDQFDGLCSFAKTIGFQIIFGINGGPGPRYNQDGVWSPTNAKELMVYSKSVGCPVKGWELSNEPNLYLFNFGVENFVSATQLGKDFKTFHNLVESQSGQDVLSIGPDIAYQIPVLGELVPYYMEDFLKEAGPLLDVVTWHFYPLQSNQCPAWQIDPWYATPERAIEQDTLNEMEKWQREVQSLASKHAPHASVWLGESSCVSCGGQIHVANAFACCFWYLDTLGQSLLNGSVMVRQDIAGSWYGLLNDTDLQPNPDYWNAALYKSLTMPVSFLATSSRKDVRVYAMCSNSGGISLVVLNTGKEEVEIQLQGIPSFPREEYVITADSLTSSILKLNNVPLALKGDGTVPPFQPKRVTTDQPITIEGISYAFYQLDTKVPSCTALL